MTPSELIQKYNVPVPRYTSYPTANNFREYTNEEYLRAIAQSNSAKNNQLSFYLHIPFCRHLCHYCGCNSFPMARPEVVEEYVKSLHREIDILMPMLDKNRKISQIHYGGGSPTAINLKYIRELNEHLLSSFSTIDRPEIAIECHPGYLTREDWTALSECGFTRFSIGIQDFNPQVLKTVNRRPSLIPEEDIFDILRSKGARINLDFIYGLPGQTVRNFSDTIKHAVTLHPDRLVTFSYAHVPWVNKRQLILEKAGLPSREEKIGMFDAASSLLRGAGYRPIGMDHFVLPDDDLNLALENHQLHRNFQGYCPRRITAQVYALGISGISQLETAYAQNTKDIEQYMEAVKKGELCTAKGYTLSEGQQITREVIESMMCNYRIDWEELSQRLHLSIEEIKAATDYNDDKLRELAADGLITYNEKMIRMTDAGTPFVRNVAASMDKMMRNGNQHFSRPI